MAAGDAIGPNCFRISGGSQVSNATLNHRSAPTADLPELLSNMPPDQPVITIVTVAKDAGNALPLTIESVLGQDYANLEYLIIDGMSVDSTYEVLNRYSGLIESVIPVEDNGIYSAMNLAADVAKGEFILFLNAGDLLHSHDSISAIVRRLEGNPDIVYGDHIYRDGRKEYHFSAAPMDWLRSKLHRGEVSHEWHRLIPCHQATFTRTTLLKSLRYNEGFRICADHELLFRAFDEGASFQYVDEIVCQYVAGGISGTAADQVRREWLMAYRYRSLAPGKIDQMFFPSADKPALPWTTDYSGTLLSGAFDDEWEGENITPMRWVSDIHMMAPNPAGACAIMLKGYSPFAGQQISASVEGEMLACAAIPQGEFSEVIVLPRNLRPGDRLALHATVVERLSLHDSREAAWKAATLQFLDGLDVAQMPHQINVAQLTPDARRRAFISGWSDLAEHMNTVKSFGSESFIALRMPSHADQISMKLLANCDNDTAISVEVFINGKPSASSVCLPGSPTEINCCAPRVLVTGANTIKFRVSPMSHLDVSTSRNCIDLLSLHWSATA